MSLVNTFKQPMEMRIDGIPLIPPPSQNFTIADYIKKGIFLTIIQIAAPSFMAVMYVSNKTFRIRLDSLYSLVNDAGSLPKESFFQDPELLKRVWQLPSAQHYIRNGALMYQKTEGYCGIATLRCILKSFDSFPSDWLPEQTAVPQTPETWSANLRQLVDNCNRSGAAGDKVRIEADIVQNDMLQYDDFLKTIRRLNNPEEKGTRIAINYLRSALTGFQSPKWLPMNFLLGLFSGHFSPIVGVLEDSSRSSNDPLVAVFDVNHKYGGTYLVPAKRLHASIQSIDISTGKGRGMVVVTE